MEGRSRRTRRKSGSASELARDFRTSLGPVAAIRAQGSLSLDPSDLISTK